MYHVHSLGGGSEVLLVVTVAVVMVVVVVLAGSGVGGGVPSMTVSLTTPAGCSKLEVGMLQLYSSWSSKLSNLMVRVDTMLGPVVPLLYMRVLEPSLRPMLYFEVSVVISVPSPSVYVGGLEKVA